MSARRESAPPTVGEVERWVLDACRDLGLPAESGADDFFAAGGTSLTVVRLVARAEAEFGDDCLPPDDMYERSTLHDIAVAILRNRTPTAAGDEHTVVTAPGEM